MASLKSRAVVAVLWLSRRQRRHRTAEAARARVAYLARHPSSHKPSGLHLPYTLDDSSGWPVYRVDTGAQNEVIYIHGGSYLNQIVRQHWQFIGHVARHAPANVTVPIHPLAPTGTAETTVPAMADLIADVIHRIAGPRRVTLIGDSSGGGLALAATQLLRDSGRALPHALVLIAPWLDLTMSHPDQPRLTRLDPMLDLPGLAEAGRIYAAGLGPEHPFASPLRGDLTGLPPITIYTGTRDVLHPDSLALAGHAEIHVGQGMPHVYPLLPMPEGASARAEIARIIDRST
ncbi:MAG TPA: alpha/beta hydrolase fold domain-containing protein [Candidatus Limnocylindrales bacterium]|nr:alpha/beta hydrolase fold domain-containing protein [Candidatus Limnocylindrales bacterium]